MLREIIFKKENYQNNFQYFKRVQLETTRYLTIADDKPNAIDN